MSKNLSASKNEAPKSNKNKGGRPQKDLADKLVSLTIHVTPADYMWLSKGAEMLKIRLSEFARDMLQLHAQRRLRRLRVPLTSKEEQAATKLAEVANTLARLEQRAEKKGDAEAAAELREQGQQVAHFLSQLARV